MLKILALLLTINVFALEVSFNKIDWQVLSYSGITPNQFQFEKSHLKLKIDKSASPLIYPLKKPINVKELSFKGRVQGQLNLKEKQGEKGSDDFLLRVGLVYEGEQTLNWFQKKIAASWIIKLFELAPSGTGVSHIQFYNIYSDDRLNGVSRTHPLSELIKESMVAKVDNQQEFEVKINIEQKRKVLAIWISSDGDDTNSQFEVLINSLSLQSN